MPTAETIAIGTELLLGEIQDTNTAYIARKFRDHGVDFYRATIIGDNYKRIGSAIQEALTRSDIILTTGGLGPTVDDPTRQAVAHALGVELEFHPELWEQILERFQRYHRQPTENNRRQAYLPAGATVLENPVGTAPAFYAEVENKLIISLPGVPREMETILDVGVIPLLEKKFSLQGVIKALVLHTAGAGESIVDEWIGDLEILENPTVGLLAHPGQVDIRITAKAGSVEEADAMIAEVANTIHKRVGNAVYGIDQETLEQVITRQLAVKKWQLVIVECGLDNNVQKRLLSHPETISPSIAVTETCQMEVLKAKLSEALQNTQAQAGLGVIYTPGPVQQKLYLTLVTPGKTYETDYSYGGPPPYGETWAVNSALDFIRRNIT
jgi:nicotinamide-nucleotide amidase